jgi:hypothetical protein
MVQWTEDLALRAIPGLRHYLTIADMLADTTLTTTVGSLGSVAPGNTIIAKREGFSYRVAAADATDHNLTTAGGVKLYAVGANEPFALFPAGQSNERSNEASVGGYQTFVDGIYTFDNDSSSGTDIVAGAQWRPARFGEAPLNIGSAGNWANSVAWQAARVIQRLTGRPVYIYKVSLGGAEIEDFMTPAILAANGWTASHNFSDLMLAKARAALSAIPGRYTTTWDAVLWIHGGANANEPTHLQAFKVDTLANMLADYGLIDKAGTPFVVMELCQFRAYRRRHLAAMRYLQTTFMPLRVLRSVGIADVGDGLHWTGPAMEEVGARMAGAIFTQPDFFEVENQDVLTATEDGLICLTTREFAHRTDADKRPAVPMASVIGTVGTAVSGNLGFCYTKAAGASVEWVSRRVVRMPTEAVARITAEFFVPSGTVNVRLRVYAFNRDYGLIDTYDHVIGGETIPTGVVTRISATFGLLSSDPDVAVPYNTGFFAYAISISEGVTEPACEFNWLDARIDQPVATQGATSGVLWLKEPNGRLEMWEKAVSLTSGPQVVTVPFSMVGGASTIYIVATPESGTSCKVTCEILTDTTFQFSVWNDAGARVAATVAFYIKARWKA